MANDSLGSYVMTRRKAAALKQSDLANALGYTSQAISKFESGESQIALEVLPKLANLLSLSLDDLLLRNPNPGPS
jgi:transcriptional regulator with XRE-family HTH domain